MNQEVETSSYDGVGGEVLDLVSPVAETTLRTLDEADGAAAGDCFSLRPFAGGAGAGAGTVLLAIIASPFLH